MLEFYLWHERNEDMTFNSLLHDIRSDVNAIYQGLGLIGDEHVNDPNILELLKKIRLKAQTTVNNIRKIEFEEVTTCQSNKGAGHE